MTESNDHAHGHEHGHGHDDHSVPHPNYFKIYWTLLALLAVSVAGPMLEIKVVTLVTAFGIALVKAYLVAANFMHLKFEKKYVVYLLATALAFMFIFYAGVSPDVMNHQGRNWSNVAAKQETQRALEAQTVAHEHGGGHEHGEH